MDQNQIKESYDDDLSVAEIQNSEILSKSKNARTKSKQQIVLEREYFVGPIPPPNILKQYNDIQPGFADRIISLAEKENQHRHEIEKSFVNNNFSLYRAGQICGCFVTSLAIVTGAVVAIKGSVAFGGLLSTAGLAALASTFIYGKYQENKKLRTKNKISEST